MCVAVRSFTSLYSLMSLVSPLSSISPKGLLVSGHLKNVKIPNIFFKCKKTKNMTEKRDG